MFVVDGLNASCCKCQLCAIVARRSQTYIDVNIHLQRLTFFRRSSPIPVIGGLTDSEKDILRNVSMALNTKLVIPFTPHFPGDLQRCPR